MTLLFARIYGLVLVAVHHTALPTVRSQQLQYNTPAAVQHTKALLDGNRLEAVQGTTLENCKCQGEMNNTKALRIFSFVSCLLANNFVKHKRGERGHGCK